MNTLGNPKYTTLLFRSKESIARNPSPDKFEPDDYYAVTSYPVAEMLSSNAIAAAGEFIGITLSPIWRLKFRRRLKPGDAIEYAGSTYIFANKQMEKHFNQNNIIELEKWPHLCLIELNNTETKCKV